MQDENFEMVACPYKLEKIGSEFAHTPVADSEYEPEPPLFLSSISEYWTALYCVLARRKGQIREPQSRRNNCKFEY